MNTTFDLEAKLVHEGAAELATRIKPLIKPGLYLKKVYQTQSVPQPPLLGWFKRSPKQVRIGMPVAVGASKLGGLPDFPPGQAWPGTPTGQCNSSRKSIVAKSPRSGFDRSASGRAAAILSIRSWQRDARCSLHQESTCDRRKFRVDHLPGIVVAAVRGGVRHPADHSHSEAEEYKALKLSEEDDELLQETQAVWASEIQSEQHGLHQIGGYPDAVQGDVFTEVEFYTAGKKSSWDEAAARASQWRLLLQFDTDGDLDVMWGDAGMIYFCVREDDLRAGRFERVRSTMQCG